LHGGAKLSNFLEKLLTVRSQSIGLIAHSRRVSEGNNGIDQLLIVGHFALSQLIVDGQEIGSSLA
jgi:hypothetical protein